MGDKATRVIPWVVTGEAQALTPTAPLEPPVARGVVDIDEAVIDGICRCTLFQ